MYNPYALLSIQLMESLMKSNRYFVRQSYPRGRDHFDENIKGIFLLTYYYEDDIETTRAQMHASLLKADPYCFLYDARNAEHRDRLLKAASQPAGYKVYINLLPAKWKAPTFLRDKIANYIGTAMPEWRVNRYSKLDITLQERFGNLYLDLHWKGRTPRNFIIDPTGNFLLVANQNSDNVTVFRRNSSTGLLTKLNQTIKVPNPVCLKLMRL